MIEQVIEFAKTNQYFAAFAGGAGLSYVLYAIRQIPNKIISVLNSSIFTTFTVRSDNKAFPWIASWIASHRSLKRARSLKLVLGKDKSNSHAYSDGAEEFFLTLGDGAPHMMLLNGWRPCFVSRTRIDGVNEAVDEISFRVLGRSHEPIKRLVDQTEKMREHSVQRYCFLHEYGSNWERHSPLAPRAPESIFLDDSAEQKLWSSIDNFMTSKERYERCGTIWKLGIFLHGPPGTGKSSIIRAIGTKYSRDIYIASINSIPNDKALIKAFSGVPERAIIAIEDIDTISSSRDREAFKDENGEKGDGVSLSGLLNALDGVVSQSNQIIIITSNRPDIIDPALLRPGRIDLNIEIANATKSQIMKMAKFHLGFDIDKNIAEQLVAKGGISTAAIHTALFYGGVDGLKKLVDSDPVA
jgi:SpoVK/Ycf46/Vps4 family AAA+-type ATPase